MLLFAAAAAGTPLHADTWSAGGTRLHGVHVGARALVGPAGYRYEEGYTCSTPTPSTFSCGPVGVDPELPARAARVEAQPFVRAHWIGHPGITLGAELGLDVVVTPTRAETEPLLGPYGATTLGWSAPFGEPPITKEDALSRLSPEDAARRRRQN